MVARVFIIRPFGEKPDSAGTLIDFEHVHRTLLAPALEQTNLAGSTTTELLDAGNIRADMFELILEADVVVCDVTINNPNVFYELGVRHALRKRTTIMVRGSPTADRTPFDLLTDRYLQYQIDDPSACVQRLVETIRSSRDGDRRTDSPVFAALEGLEETEPTAVRQAPQDFIDEVGRAEAARSAGWLRILAEDVLGMRFQWDGLTRVASAQWHIGDRNGAQQNWQKVTAAYPDNVAANLGLATAWERASRTQERPEDLLRSDQAIARVLEAPRCDRATRAEALSLKGRNLKTRWRAELAGIKGLADRRAAATSKRLSESYEAYRAAYLSDLNAFYPGLAALQSGTILASLAEDEAWPDMFDSDSEAARYREELEREIDALSATVSLALTSSVGAVDPEQRLWSDISSADLKFLTLDSDRRAEKAYKDAIPVDRAFAWDAARGQLELFESLGVRADRARRVIDAMEARMAPHSTRARPRHLIVFAGHMLDDEGAPPRFPRTAAAEVKARDLIKRALESLKNDDDEIVALASGAHGADLLAHDAFSELGFRGTLCLPMPRDAYARETFGDLTAWRTRYLNLLASGIDVIELSDQADIPRWLRGHGVSLWERGNRWFFALADTWRADRRTLVALWDRKHSENDQGTAHLVELAKASGRFHVRIIEASGLAG